MSAVRNNDAVGTVTKTASKPDTRAVPHVSGLCHQQMEVSLLVDPGIRCLVVAEFPASPIIGKRPYLPIIAAKMKDFGFGRPLVRGFCRSNGKHCSIDGGQSAKLRSRPIALYNQECA